MIGHASISENGTVNGVAGDSTKKEVCTRSFYVHKNGWTYVLRPHADIAEKMAVACEKGCVNDRIGYSQATRNTLHTEAKKVGYDLANIQTPCNCDCSSFMTICAIAAGVKSLEYTSNAPTTRTMRDAFARTGKFEILTDRKYLISDEYLKRGDVLVSAGHHTVMVLTNGAKAGTAAGTRPIAEIAQEVINGKWGNGEERKKNLEAAGYPYKTVQAEVNRILSSQPKHLSQRGIDFIVAKEGGYKLKAYKLAGEKYYTIGAGHHGADVLPNMTISKEFAETLFKTDVAKFEKYVTQYVTNIPLTQGRFDALVSYTYNRGLGGLKELVANSHSIEEYSENIVKYWGKAERYKNGLIKRRKEEQAIFNS